MDKTVLRQSILDTLDSIKVTVEFQRGKVAQRYIGTETATDDLMELIEAHTQAAYKDGARDLWSAINGAPKDSWYGTAHEFIEALTPTKEIAE